MNVPIITLAVAVGVGASAILLLFRTIGIDVERAEHARPEKRSRAPSSVPDTSRAEPHGRWERLTNRERMIATIAILALIVAVLAVAVAGFLVVSPGPPYPS